MRWWPRCTSTAWACCSTSCPTTWGSGRRNPYWEDVLANGERSQCARLFDIDWLSHRRQLRASPSARARRRAGGGARARRARGHARRRRRAPRSTYFDNNLPLAPETRAAARTGKLPRGGDAAAARRAALHARVLAARRAEINYRRFFDINELAALRAEDQRAFDATHALPLARVEAGELDGLRIDHIDGLLDPQAYLDACAPRSTARTARGAASMRLPDPRREDPLAGRAAAPRVAGARHDGLRVPQRPRGRVRSRRRGATRWRAYRRTLRLRDDAPRFHEVASAASCASCAGRCALTSSAGAWRAAHRGARLPAPRRARASEFGDGSLQLLAALPVYRTYVDATGSRRRAPTWSWSSGGSPARRTGRPCATTRCSSRDVLLLREAARPRTAPHSTARVRRAVPAVSGPATAKGIEDTALYLYYPLSSRNEVGGEPDGDLVATPSSAFHRDATGARRRWPQALLSTNTHDTKRSADVRARLDVLSEMPDDMERRRREVAQAARAAAARRAGASYPDANTEYLFLQTRSASGRSASAARAPTTRGARGPRRPVHAYMLKAAKEGKTMTSWTEPDEAFEEAWRRTCGARSTHAQSPEWLPWTSRGSSAGSPPRACGTRSSRVTLHLTTPGTPGPLPGRRAVDLRAGGSRQPAAGGLAARERTGAIEAARTATRGGPLLREPSWRRRTGASSSC